MLYPHAARSQTVDPVNGDIKRASNTVLRWRIMDTSWSSSSASSWTAGTVAKIVLLGVVPAFSTFGFYRLWFGLVELSPDSFYQKDEQGRYLTEDDSKAEVHLTPSAGTKNVAFGFAYIAVGAAPLIFRLLL